jgi:hypothetical protein
MSEDIFSRKSNKTKNAYDGSMLNAISVLFLFCLLFGCASNARLGCYPNYKLRQGRIQRIRIIGDFLVSKSVSGVVYVAQDREWGDRILDLLSKRLNEKGYEVVETRVVCVGCFISGSSDTYKASSWLQRVSATALTSPLRPLPFYIHPSFIEPYDKTNLLLNDLHLLGNSAECNTAGIEQIYPKLTDLKSNWNEDAILYVGAGWQEATSFPNAIVESGIELLLPKPIPSVGYYKYHPFLQLRMMDTQTGEIIWGTGEFYKDDCSNVEKMLKMANQLIRFLPRKSSRW